MVSHNSAVFLGSWLLCDVPLILAFGVFSFKQSNKKQAWNLFTSTIKSKQLREQATFIGPVKE